MHVNLPTTPSVTAQLKTPVLFLVFNRPDVTAQVFQAIREARPTKLYVAADGPRADRIGEEDTCAEVRKLATDVDWPCEVKTLFREGNLGCKVAVSGGISWFFDNEDEGIILEDDCLPNQSFFWFCEALLDKYRHDQRIGMIAGTRMAKAAFEGKSSYSFSRLVQIWGWATWRRSWNGYDSEMAKWPAFKQMNGFECHGIPKGITSYLQKNFEKTHQGLINTWDYQWSFKCIVEGQLTVFPRNNLIRNIGFGPDATHTIGLGSMQDCLIEQEDISRELQHPTFIMPNLEYDERKSKRKPLVTRIYKFIKE